MNLQDKVAIVTGAASGLGLATCKTLSAAGARVVGFDRDAGRLAESMGPDMTAVEVDVSDDRASCGGSTASVHADREVRAESIPDDICGQLDAVAAMMALVYGSDVTIPDEAGRLFDKLH